MKAAGYSSGKYDGSNELLLIAANVDPGKAQAEVAKAQLEKLGFKIRMRTVPQDAVYTEWCQQPAKKVAICGSAGWFKDYNDPQSMLEQTFKGSNIHPEGGNNNLGQLNDPKIDKAMDAALRHIAPAMHRGRYELVERSPERLVFTYAHRPVWTYAVAVGVFPFGLIALMYTTEERIVLDFDRARGGATRLVVTGRAPRGVRRAFAELEAA